MNNIRINLAADINRFHELACQRADEAIDNAKQAGILLLEAKAALQHGDWLPWLEQNIFVSPRQVQRYMQVAQGRALPIRTLASKTVEPVKYDAVSHLPNTDTLPLKPGFVAIPGHFMLTIHRDRLYCIEQSTLPGYFFVSQFLTASDDDAVIEYLTKPIRGDYVDVPLRAWGMEDPKAVAWTWGPQDRPIAHAFDYVGSAA